MMNSQGFLRGEGGGELFVARELDERVIRRQFGASHLSLIDEQLKLTEETTILQILEKSADRFDRLRLDAISAQIEPDVVLNHRAWGWKLFESAVQLIC